MLNETTTLGTGQSATISAEGLHRESNHCRNRLSGCRQLLLARMREMLREPELIIWRLVIPPLLALVLGIAFRSRPTEVASVAIIAGPGAEHTLTLLQHSHRNSIPVDLLNKTEALRGFQLGKYALLIESANNGNLQYLYNPWRPESVLARAEIDSALQTAAGRIDALATSAVASSQPGDRYIDFLIPGMLGMSVMNSAMWGIGFVLVEMRQRKLLKLYLATPMCRSHFILTLASSRVLLMLLEVLLLLAVGTLAFQMKVLGSLITVGLVCGAGAMAFAALGLLIASRAENMETVSGLINLIILPMWIFSGVFFSHERFPAVAQPIIKLLPLTALNDALRVTILQGAPLHAQTGRLMVLILWGGISFFWALRRFRWN